jgi:hypothetical protein
MRNWKLLAVGVAIAALTATLAIGQQPLNFTGNETWVVNTASGSGVPISLNQARNGTGYQTVAGGGTVASTPTNAINNLIAIGAITTWNVTLPNPAFDGELFSVVNGTAAAFTTNVTVTVVNTPQNQTLFGAFTSNTLLANGGGAEWQFQLSNLTWYRVR